MVNYFYSGARWGCLEMTSGGEPRKINSVLQTLLKTKLFMLIDHNLLNIKLRNLCIIKN
jgi:hypothetical protein